MSVKQLRHAQQTAASLAAPQSFGVKLQRSAQESGHLQGFLTELLHLTQVHNSQKELEVLKVLARSLKQLSQEPEDESASLASSLLLEVLFFNNSRHLHKQLLSSLRQLGPQQRDQAGQLLASQITAAVGELHRRLEHGLPQHMPLPAAVSAVLDDAVFRPVLRSCCRGLLEVLPAAILAVTAAGKAGSHLPADLTHAAQEAVSCLYSLLQTFGLEVASADGQPGAEGICLTADAMMSILQGSSIAREAMSSAAATLQCAAALPQADERQLAEAVANGLFGRPGGRWHAAETGLGTPRFAATSLIERRWQRQGTGLAQQLQQLSGNGWICAVKGLLQALPAPVQTTPLLWSPTQAAGAVQGLAGTPRMQLLAAHVALPAICSALTAATETHTKYHAVGALAACLDQMKAVLQEVKAPSDVGWQGSVTSCMEAGNPLDLTLGSADSSTASPGQPRLQHMAHMELLDASGREELTQLMLQIFQDPVLQSYNQSEQAFRCFLDLVHLQQQQQQQEQTGSGSEADLWMLALAQKLITMRPPQKGVISLLGSLVQYTGARKLLHLQPDLFGQLLAAMERGSLGSVVPNLLHKLLEQLRREVLAATGSHDEGMRQWRQQWSPALLAGLLSSREDLRQAVATQALPVVLQLDAASLLHLMRATLDAPQQQIAGVVALLKAAHRLHLADGLEVVSIQEGEVAIPASLLQRGVRHASEALRVDVMQLCCMGTASTKPPSSLELSLMAESLQLNMRCAAGLRHKVASHLDRLMQRILVSSMSMLSRRHRASSMRSDDVADAELQGLQHLQEFVQWVTRYLVGCLYPEAPSSRKYLAMQLLNTVLDVWQTPNGSTKFYQRPDDTVLEGDGALRIGQHSFAPFYPGFFGPDLMQKLLETALDSWDQLRQLAVAALARMPAPLPGLQEPAQVEGVLCWACSLLDSPRQREADAGGRLLGMIFTKYSVQLRWHVRVFPSISALPSTGQQKPAGEKGLTVLCFLASLLKQLQAQVAAAEGSLWAACHGTLLTLRYLVLAVPWRDVMKSQGVAQALRQWVAQLLETLLVATDLVLPHLARTGTNSDADQATAKDWPADEECYGGPTPAAQATTTGCWLTMKETALVMGCLACSTGLTGVEEEAGHVLTVAQVQRMGHCLLGALLQLQHYGAIDKTAEGFQMVIKRLLEEPSQELNALPACWLQQLLDHVARPGQTVDDVVRRSAGLPYAFVALFAAEPGGRAKPLLQKGLKQILHIAGNKKGESMPRVHALNVIRMAFSNTALAKDISEFLQQGIEVAIVAMAAPEWEVRNAASLAFTSLLVRLLGFRNPSKGQQCRGMSGADLFARCPGLHAFLLAELKDAAAQLQREGSALHPSLFPVLMLLSHLKPSTSSINNRKHSPAHLQALVQRCTAARPHAVRHLAARALAPLIEPGQLSMMLLQLVRRLPGPDSPFTLHNEVHGTLLQLKILLLDNSPPQEDLEALLPELQAKLWLLGIACRCPPLQTQMAAVAAQALAAAKCPLPAAAAFAQAAQKHARAEVLLWAAASEARLPVQQAQVADVKQGRCVLHAPQASQAEGGVGTTGMASLPMGAEAAKQVAALLFGPAMLRWIGPSNPQDVAAAMGSSCYEVAAACLKGVLLQHRQQGIAGGVPPLINTSLLQRLISTSKHHKIQQRALQVLAATLSAGQHQLEKASLGTLPQARGSPQVQGNGSAWKAQEAWFQSPSPAGAEPQPGLKAALDLWSAVRRLAGETGHPSVQRAAVLCLGRAVGAVTGHMKLLLQHQRQGVDPAPSQTGLHIGPQQHPQLAASATAAAQVSQALPKQGKLWLQEAVTQAAEPVFPNQGDSTPGESASSQPRCAVAGQPCSGSLLQGAAEALETTVALLGSTSQPEQLEDLRLATGQALGTAGLLVEIMSEQPGARTRGVVAWALVVRLLEDDSAEVRSGAAVTAGAALERLRVPTAAAAIHVEHALRLAVQLVGACAPHCAAAWQQLMDWVLPTARVLPEHSALHVVSAASATAAEDSSTGVPTPADGHLAGESAAGSSSQQLGAAVGASARVFDQEADNQHEEPLLLAQLAAQQLVLACQQAPVGTGPGSGSSGGGPGSAENRSNGLDVAPLRSAVSKWNQHSRGLLPETLSDVSERFMSGSQRQARLQHARALLAVQCLASCPVSSPAPPTSDSATGPFLECPLLSLPRSSSPGHATI